MSQLKIEVIDLGAISDNAGGMSDDDMLAKTWQEGGYREFPSSNVGGETQDFGAGEGGKAQRPQCGRGREQYYSY